ncbi:MAG: hypothetical protein A3F72_19215 [Bacteroidetes bacterium RIFCSPLOWO2_12_FULL_35_15]|nr:MAG: hypothetical protein A3F72_19215 [Bacteroidetes bacterium RIFCSPLOWO2_12_FULL_35_15]
MTNSNYKIKDKDGKKGLIRIIDNVLIIPFIYEKIEFIGLQFLRAELGNKVFVVNLSNEIVLEMIMDITSEKWNLILFSHGNKTYKMFGTEECDDYFSIYFELFNNKNEKIKKKFLIVTFQENQVNYTSVTKSKLPPFF